VADIVDELRDSARTSAARGGRSIDPRRVVDRSVRLIENELRHRARLSVTLEPVPRVVADPGAIQQLVVAVLAETVATLPTGEGKRPSAHVRLASADPGAVRLDIQLGGARAGALDGTTRALAGELGAQVGWSDTPGGSCVTVTWPAAAPGPEDTDPMLMGRGVERLRRPRVLVVDDDEFVGYAFARGLEQLYEVEIAASGESALERLRHARFDAIVSDLWMPGMTGMQFYSALCEAHPWMRERIVFVTGAASDPDADAFLAGLARPALEKPCGVRDLQAAVAAIVGGGTTPTPEPCTHEARDRAAGA
jgi:CheY-like chemotaxis protein